jgi:hypothetical protein
LSVAVQQFSQGVAHRKRREVGFDEGAVSEPANCGQLLHDVFELCLRVDQELNHEVRAAVQRRARLLK